MRIMKEGPLTLASLGAAILASLCCIGPLVAAVLGLGAFGAAAVLESFRPYFLGLTALLLGGAWYLAYRPGNNAACANDACPPGNARRHTRLLLWIATGFISLFAAFPYYSPLVWKGVAQALKRVSPEPVPSRPPAGLLSAMTVQIDGMTCGGCAAAVQASLSQLKGVSQARVSFEEKSATVQYDPSLLTMDQIQEAVENAGYKATVKR